VLLDLPQGRHEPVRPAIGPDVVENLLLALRELHGTEQMFGMAFSARRNCGAWRFSLGKRGLIFVIWNSGNQERKRADELIPAFHHRDTEARSRAGL
jgi:hypothetical protein